MYHAVVVVPIKIHPQVPFDTPIMGDFVVIYEDSHEVLRILFEEIFHTKLINAEREVYQAPVMRPKSWVNFTLLIALLIQLFLE